MQMFVSRRHSPELLYVSCASLRRPQNDERMEPSLMRVQRKIPVDVRMTAQKNGFICFDGY
jgi:hypothetical protein